MISFKFNQQYTPDPDYINVFVVSNVTKHKLKVTAVQIARLSDVLMPHARVLWEWP